MKKVVTVCPYCASGCKINLVVDNGKIVRAEAAQGKTNQGTLCLKGYYGWDFINDTQILTPRLKTPMIRRQRGGKLESVSWDEALVWVNSRKGRIITRAQVSDRPNKGAVYMTYQWWIGACNELVSENLSPITKTPEYKYCAVNVEPIADQRAAEQYVIDEYNKLKTRLRESAMG